MKLRCCALYERLPDAERYESDGYRVYEWLPHNKHVAGKGRRSEPERGIAFDAARQVERLAARAEGHTKSVEMPVNPLAPVFAHKLKLNAAEK